MKLNSTNRRTGSHKIGNSVLGALQTVQSGGALSDETSLALRNGQPTPVVTAAQPAANVNPAPVIVEPNPTVTPAAFLTSPPTTQQPPVIPAQQVQTPDSQSPVASPQSPTVAPQTPQMATVVGMRNPTFSQGIPVAQAQAQTAAANASGNAPATTAPNSDTAPVAAPTVYATETDAENATLPAQTPQVSSVTVSPSGNTVIYIVAALVLLFILFRK